MYVRAYVRTYVRTYVRAYIGTYDVTAGAGSRARSLHSTIMWEGAKALPTYVHNRPTLHLKRSGEPMTMEHAERGTINKTSGHAERLECRADLTN